MAAPAQKLRAIHLYRHTLKNIVSWCIRRELFFDECERIRGLFQKNAHLNDPNAIEQTLAKGEKELQRLMHPDPLIVPYSYGGTLYQRNPPFPESMHQVLDYGRETN